MKTADKAIYELLKTYASGRVYAMLAPQNATAPFIVFQEIDSERWRSINGPSGVAQATFQIDVYDDSIYDAKTLAAQIEETLDGFSGNVDMAGSDSPSNILNIGGISLQNAVDLIDQTEEPLLYRRSATYLVTYHQE